MLDSNDYQKQTTDAIRAAAWRHGLDMHLSALRGPRADYDLLSEDKSTAATMRVVLTNRRFDVVLKAAGAAPGEGLLIRGVQVDDEGAVAAAMGELDAALAACAPAPLPTPPRPW
jgi:hypothetical protein